MEWKGWGPFLTWMSHPTSTPNYSPTLNPDTTPLLLSPCPHLPPYPSNNPNLLNIHTPYTPHTSPSHLMPLFPMKHYTHPTLLIPTSTCNSSTTTSSHPATPTISWTPLLCTQPNLPTCSTAKSHYHFHIPAPTSYIPLPTHISSNPSLFSTPSLPTLLTTLTPDTSTLYTPTTAQPSHTAIQPFPTYPTHPTQILPILSLQATHTTYTSNPPPTPYQYNLATSTLTLWHKHPTLYHWTPIHSLMPTSSTFLNLTHLFSTPIKTPPTL